jgi:hypothetical protein
MGIEEEIQRYTDNVFISIITENFPNLKKVCVGGHIRYKRHSKHQAGRIRKEAPPTYIIIKTLNIQNKEY